MRNESIGVNETWTNIVGGVQVTYTECIRQAYQNMFIAAGTVEGHPVDTLYLKMEREGEHIFFVLIRPDEAAALAWCLTGVLWSDALAKLPEEVAADA